MKRVTVTHLDDGQWFGLTQDGDFIMLEHVPKGTSSGDIIDIDDEEITTPTKHLDNIPAKRKRYMSKKYFSIAAAVLLLFASSFFQLFSSSAEASSITFYGDREWTIEVKDDGRLYDTETGEEFDMSDTAYILDKLHSIGSDQQNIWAGIDNEENNPHVHTVLNSLNKDLQANEITLYSFSFNEKWWNIKKEQNLTIKELVHLYIEDQYKVDGDEADMQRWIEELQKKHNIFK